MSQANVDLIKAVHPPSGTNLSDLFSESTAESQLAPLASLLTPDFTVAAGDGGAGSIWVEGRGLGGLIQTWRDWLEPWDEYWTEVERFVGAGEDHVLVLVRDRGRARDSDAVVELEAASVWTLREGKIARAEFHTNRENAFKAAGLSDSPSSWRVELIERLWSGWAARDRTELEAVLHTDVVWDASRRLLDQNVLSGREAVIEGGEVLTDMWSEHRFEIDLIEEAGERALTFVTITGRGRASGVEVEAHVGYVVSFEGRQIVRIDYYPERDDARRAAEGL